MPPGRRLERLPDALQDGPDQISRVEARQGHQQQVERIAHLFSEKGEILIIN